MAPNVGQCVQLGPGKRELVTFGQNLQKSVPYWSFFQPFRHLILSNPVASPTPLSWPVTSRPTSGPSVVSLCGMESSTKIGPFLVPRFTKNGPFLDQNWTHWLGLRLGHMGQKGTTKCGPVAQFFTWWSYHLLSLSHVTESLFQFPFSPIFLFQIIGGIMGQKGTTKCGSVAHFFPETIPRSPILRFK